MLQEVSTLASLLRLRSETCPDLRVYTFLAEGEREAGTLTAAGLDRRARALAAALQETARPGDRALLLFPPGLDFIAAFFGCLYAGVVAVPAYPPRTHRVDARLWEIFRDCQPRVVLTTSAILGRLRTVQDRTPELRAARWVAADLLPENLADGWREPVLEAGSLAFLQYTSGSTSAPKGVMVSQGNLIHNQRMIQRAFRQSEESVVVSWLPLYHDMGLIGGVLQPLYSGARCILMSPWAFLQSPARWLEAVSRYRATTSGGPDFAYDLCVRKVRPERRAELDLSSWQVAFNGAEPVRAATLGRFSGAFAPCGFRREAFHPCYGLAEATLLVTGGGNRSPVTLAVDAGALAADRVETGGPAGRSLVGSGRVPDGLGEEVCIVDPATEIPCESGRVGEVWVSGPHVAGGYWNRPEESERVFGASLPGREGQFLRTGDLGFFHDGELFVTGRIKDLIILRGRNLYPQDVELTVERSHPALRPGSGAAFSAEVEGEERLVVVHELEPRARVDVDRVAAAVRRAVAEEHEARVHEVALIAAGTLPKTSSGKVQRRACRAAWLGGSLEIVGRSAVAGPATDETDGAVAGGSLEERLGREVSRLAGLAGDGAVDPETPLAALGLDSLAAVELASWIETETGVLLSAVDLLRCAGLRALVTEVETRQKEGSGPEEAPAPEGPETGEHPLSPGQKALWLVDRLAPEAAAYNIVTAARVEAGLDAGALRRAFSVLARRHPALRTTFGERGGEPVQRVHAGLEPGFAEVEASGWSPGELDREAWRPFDLETGPPWRVRLFRGTEGGDVLLLAVHHLVADFWSLSTLVRELAELYRQETGGAPAVLEPLSLRYTDWVRWQERRLAGPRGERLWAYWQERLGGGLTVLDLPVDRPRPPARTWRGGSRSRRLDLATVAAARRAGGEGTTLFVTLLTAFQALLHRYTGQEDLLIGSPTTGRTGGAAVAGLVGYFVNPVALRADLSGRPGFAELAARGRVTALEALEHGDLPLLLLAERLRPERAAAGSPLFQVMFALQGAGPDAPPGLAGFGLGEEGARVRLGDLALESVALGERRALFDLTLFAAETEEGGADLALQFDADLFDAATADRLLGHLGTLLAAGAADPGRPVAALPILTAGERLQLLEEWNDTGEARPGAPLLHEAFAAQAERTPEEPALVRGEESVAYAELRRRTRELAARLARLGVGPEVRVAVLMGRRPELVVSLLGVLEAGGAYVPLDPSYPEERLAFMLEDAGAAAVLTWGEREYELARRLAGPEIPVVRLEEEEGGDGGDLPEALPGNLAYLIYTSGSTGRPKAVAIEHRSAAAFLEWAGGFFPAADLARVLASTSITFDLSVFEIFVPLSRGGAVVLADDALALPGLPAAGSPTLVNTVPSAMAELLRLGGIPSSVRVVNLAGEPLPPELVDAIHRLCPSVRAVYNLYGPSEDTTYSTVARVDPGTRPVPIGRPISGSRVHVVDAETQLVPPGVPGELLIGGAGLARGYLGRPGLTAERFIPDPFGTSPGGRLYRTGDLARYRPGGSLELLGRLDHQVKIRGFRVELGEVETALRRLEGVREAVAVARPDAGGTLSLAAFYVPGETPFDPAGLRSLLRASLPAHMVPSVLVALDALPLTPNGKVDRKALRERPLKIPGEAAETPASPAEEVLAGIWADVLGVERVGARDHFFDDLGGHSLLASRVAARAREALGVELPLRAVFERPVLAELAREIDERRRPSGLPPLERLPRDPAGVPLSFAQQRLWFLERLTPGGAAYNMPAAVRLEGRLDRGALAAALNEMARRHEPLRTTFSEVAGEARQRIAPGLDLTPPVIDLANLPAPARDEEVRELAGAEARRPFDLRTGPLVRVSLLALGADEHVALLTLHHIVSDGESMGIFLHELAALYRTFAAGEPSPLAELPVQYADFAAWQRSWLRGEALEERLAPWLQRLTGAPTALELPTDHPRPPVQRFHGAREILELSPDLVRGLRSLARKEGATLFMTLCAGLAALLSRHTGEEDLLLGTAAANRDRVEIEGLIGFFVNTLALRADLAGSPDGRGLLRRVRETALAAYAGQDLPFEALVEALEPRRDLSRAPLVQVFLGMQPPLPAVTLPGLALHPAEVETGTAKFDLSMTAAEAGPGLALTLEYDRDLFDAVTMRRFLGHFGSLLTGLADPGRPGRPVGEIPILSDGERLQLLEEWNDTGEIRPGAPLLHEAFAAQAERTPEALALVWGEESVTYAELRRRARGIAARLARLGVGPEARVGVLMGRRPELVASLLGVLEAGGAYVPLDPAYPEERLAFMLEDAGAAAVLTWGEREHALARRLAGPAGPEMPVVRLEEEEEGAGVALPSALPGNLAYLIYTSGSTGRPKAVAIEHRSAAAFLEWAGGFFAAADLERVLGSTSIAFDLSVFEIFAPLSRGGAVVLADNALALPGLPAAGSLTLVNTVPSAMAELLRLGEFPAGVRVVNLAGEPLAPELVDAIYRLCPSVRAVYNLYGPSEDTTYSTAARVDPGTRPVLVGRPIAGSRAYVVAPGADLAPPGVPGELLLGGAGLARGYLGRPDLTAERFVPDPFATSPGGRLYRTGDRARYRPGGALELLGRVDHQVKIRGFRIELGEVEAALRRHEGVREAVAVDRPGAGGVLSLAAFYVPGEVRTRPADLRSFLRRSLPEHMVPSLLVALDALPLTPNGKVDRKALRERPVAMREEAPAAAAPRTPAEEVLAGIWADVLDVERVGTRDHFFERGGHSLRASRVAARVREAFGVELPLRALFERPVLADLAREIDERRRPSGLPPLTPLPRGPEGAPLSFAQQRLWFLDRLAPGGAVYNMPAAVRLEGRLDRGALAAALNEVARRHEPLRTTFAEAAEEIWQRVAPGLDLTPPVIDLADLPAPARDAQVRELAAQEARRPFDLETGPLVRVSLLALGADEHVALLTLHHIVSDGESMGIFLRELAALYRAFAAGEPSPLAELPVQYADFAAWQRSWLHGEALEERLAPWLRRLAGAPTVLELPTDRPRPPVQRFRGARETLELSPDAVRGLRSLAREEGATLFMTLCAGLATLLSRYTGKEDLLLGIAAANRDRAEIEGLIGFFVNTLVLRADLAGSPDGRGLLRRVREAALAAYAGQDLPFEALVEALEPRRDLSHAPLVQVLLAMQPPLSAVTLPGLALRPAEVETGTAKFDLSLLAAESGPGLVLSLEYDRDLFDVATARRFLDHLGSLLTGLADPDRPGRPVDDIPVLGELAARGTAEAAWREQPEEERNEVFQPPRTPVEELVAQLWAGLLGLERVGVKDSFFDLGGHSLLATRLLSRVRDAFGVDLPLRALFEEPTVAGLAARLERERRGEDGPPLLRTARTGPLPLSFAQQRLWFLHQLAPESPFYNMPGAFLFAGRLDEAALAAGLREIARRHETLRTRFTADSGGPRQEVLPTPEVGLPVADLSALPPVAGEAEARRLALAEARRPFDLERGPLLRLTLLRLGPERRLLLATLHHIVSDGWSMGVLFREIPVLYQAFAAGRPSPLTELPVQYADFTLWQRERLGGPVRERELAYWRDRLQGVPSLELPTDHPRPARQSFRGATLTRELPDSLMASLRALARQWGATPFMVLLAAFQALLHRYTGQDEIVVGSPIANRDRTEIEGLIGFFVNTLVLRTPIVADAAFPDLVARVRDVALGAYAHQALPFETLVEELQPERDLSKQPLFQMMFQLLENPVAPVELPGVRVEPVEVDPGTAHFDLGLDLFETPAGTRALARYGADLFDAPTVRRLLEHYAVLLAGIAEAPERAVSGLPLLTPPEVHQVYWEWNDTIVAEALPPVHHAFEAVAAARPGAVAVFGGEEELTYRELERRANRLAHRLVALGVRPSMPVALHVERTPEMAVALLAIWKAGGAFLPLDPGLPRPRLAVILDDAFQEVEGALVLTQASLAGNLPESRARVVLLEEEGPDLAEPPETVSGDLAYLIYTSGTSGIPKAVRVGHAGLANVLAASRRDFGWDERDRMPCLASFSFDIFLFELLNPLLAGGTAVLVSLRPVPDVVRLVDALPGLTRIHAVPALMREIVDEVRERGDGETYPGLRTAFTGGDAVPADLLADLQEVFPHTDVRVLYGPTEGTIICSSDLVPRGAAARSLLGRPLGNVTLRLRDRAGNLAPIGVPGEITIGGAAVALGYLHREELTRERFATLDGERCYRTGDLARFLPDGALEFLGRADQQVKIRGFRIEPGEVEAALLRHAAVHEAAVLAREDTPGERRLVAYVVCRPHDDPHWVTESEGELESEQVEQWRTVYDTGLFGHAAAELADPTFNVSGWNSSYTGEPIPESEMREWVDGTVGRILDRLPSRPPAPRVLEIGCGTGLLLFRLAPHCRRYVGTDFSATELDYVRGVLESMPDPPAGVELRRALADDFSDVEPGSFEAVVLNSVSQYFPSADYLVRVIAGAVRAVAPGGFVFVGDVRNLALLRALHASVELERAPASLSRERLAGRVEVRMAEEEELLLAPALFPALRAHLPGVTGVEVQLRRGTGHNELTRFRYDAVLYVGAAERGAVPWDWRQEGLSLAALRDRLLRLLRDGAPADVLLRRVPNARVAAALETLALLDDPEGPETASGLRQAVATAVQEGAALDPESFWALEREVPYAVTVTWSETGGPGCFDVLFRRRNAEGAAPVRTLPPGQAGHGPWSRYANNPLRQRIAQGIVPALRSFLAERLPDYMVPSAVVVLERLPRSSHGKVDRKALPAPENLRPELDAAYEAPRDPVEQALSEIWGSLLEVDRVGVHDNFFDLGGHSLMATRVVAAVRRSMGVEVPLRDLFESPTVAGLAAAVSRASRTEAEAIPRQPRQPGVNRFPVSFSQLREWLLVQFEPGTTAYNVAGAVRLTGRLDAPLLERALDALVERHESLRTTFEAGLGGVGEPLQAVAPSLRVPLPRVDLSALPGDLAERTARRLIQGEATTPFDLARGPLFRAFLLRFGPGHHVLLFNMHHIVSDGWSVRGVLFPELAELYSALVSGSAGRPPALRELPVQYPDFAVWQRGRLQGEVLASHLDYWKERLAGAPPLLDVPTDRPRPAVRSGRGSRMDFALGAGPTAALRDLARRERASLFMALLAVFKTVLHRYSGQHDLPVGTYISNRRQAELEGLIGFFINTLVLRTDLSGSPGFRELLGRVREVTLGAYAHQDLPFEKVLDALHPERDVSRTPLIQALLTLQNFPSTRLETPELTLDLIPVTMGVTDFDLTLMLTETPDGIAGYIDYSTDLYEAATIRTLLAVFVRVAEAAAADPGRPVDSLPLMSEAERCQVIESGVAAPAGPSPSVQELVAAQARVRPGAPAVEHEGMTLTYAELEERAGRLARRLRALGVGPEVVVGIALERCPAAMVAMLGVLQAGGAYVPLDPAYPAERLAFMLEDSGARVLITGGDAAADLPRVELTPGGRLGGMEEEPGTFMAPPESPAYIIYTSGSTGRPKGVLVPRRALAHYAGVAAEGYGIGPGDRVLQFASLSFDTSAEEIYPCLTRGATLVLRNETMAASIAGFLSEAERLRITVLDLPTAYWHELVAALEAGGMSLPPSLRLVILGGEKALADRMAVWVRHAGPDLRLVNTYGPTEATIVSTRWDLPDGFAPGEVPIGRAIPGAEAWALDRRLEPVPPGVPAELFVGGAGLARGYHGRPDLTAERFLPHPFAVRPGERLYRTGDLVRLRPDGELQFLGRADQQIKLRGFRIEPGEIEAALRRHPGVHDAVAGIHQDRHGTRRLAAWVVPVGTGIPPAGLRSFLKELLPEHMVPALFVPLAALPLTPGGKVDRRRLPAPEEERPDTAAAYVAPRNDLERTLAAVWREILPVDRVGVNDNFFELGGDSLLLLQAHRRLAEALGAPAADLSVIDLFQYPTVAALAQRLGSRAMPAREAAPDRVRERTSQQREALARQKQKMGARPVPPRRPPRP